MAAVNGSISKLSEVILHPNLTPTPYLSAQDALNVSFTCKAAYRAVISGGGRQNVVWVRTARARNIPEGENAVASMRTFYQDRRIIRAYQRGEAWGPDIAINARIVFVSCIGASVIAMIWKDPKYTFHTLPEGRDFFEKFGAFKKQLNEETIPDLELHATELDQCGMNGTQWLRPQLSYYRYMASEASTPAFLRFESAKASLSDRYTHFTQTNYAHFLLILGSFAFPPVGRNRVVRIILGTTAMVHSYMHWESCQMGDNPFRLSRGFAPIYGYLGAIMLFEGMTSREHLPRLCGNICGRLGVLRERASIRAEKAWRSSCCQRVRGVTRRVFDAMATRLGSLAESLFGSLTLYA